MHVLGKIPGKVTLIIYNIIFSLSRSYPYLETTTMILTSANDDVLTNPCNNKNDEVFKKPWRDELASLVRMMSADRPDFGFYIENCPYHTVVPNLWLYHLHQVTNEFTPMIFKRRGILI